MSSADVAITAVRCVEENMAVSVPSPIHAVKDATVVFHAVFA
ncbi:hypothetical protein ACWGCW_18690 [Streptomyces sp. NPDC054933]